ncbi:MAG: flavodoxin [Methanobacteriaceae archaeon]|nr:flavodoxin [Methanobacteriaceae archaeon]
MKTLIIYYYNKKNIKIVAETLAKELECYICEVKDLKNRKGFKNRLNESIDAFRESKTEIYPPNLDLEEYDLIYFGTPTISNNPSPAIITMIDRCDLRGKDVILFATMASSGGESAIETMEEKIKYRGGRVIESFTLETKGMEEEDVIRSTESLISTLDLKMYSAY